MAGQFHAVDYVVFFVVMAISLGIGVLQGFIGVYVFLLLLSVEFRLFLYTRMFFFALYNCNKKSGDLRNTLITMSFKEKLGRHPSGHGQYMLSSSYLFIYWILELPKKVEDVLWARSGANLRA